MAEQCEHLLQLLAGPDPQLREIALLRLEGHTVEEIAARLHCCGGTVKRKLRVIRSLWKKEDGP
jgi:DNA-directed RNA polymerase specialized sigma24 family protein